MVNPTYPTQKPVKKPWSERLKRLLRYRLVIPLKRSRHPPEYTARGVAVGLFWALTPTVGIQMAVVLIHWWISRRFFRRDFSLVVAMAWTWLTNIFTLLPFYYLFYFTGKLMLWGDEPHGYTGFVNLWKSTVGSAGNMDEPFSELIRTWGAIIFKDWFAVMLIGSLPYAIVGAWLGWRWSLTVVKAYREARQRRALRREQEARDALAGVRVVGTAAKPRRAGPKNANSG